jgi:hypothetical protein
MDRLVSHIVFCGFRCIDLVLGDGILMFDINEIAKNAIERLVPWMKLCYWLGYKAGVASCDNAGPSEERNEQDAHRATGPPGAQMGD